MRTETLFLNLSICTPRLGRQNVLSSLLSIVSQMSPKQSLSLNSKMTAIYGKISLNTRWTSHASSVDFLKKSEQQSTLLLLSDVFPKA